MNKVQARRLLNVARALREAPDPAKFSMHAYCDNTCGTPACALGHYAARGDLQRLLAIRVDPSDGRKLWWMQLRDGDRTVSHRSEAVLDHFGIDGYETDELFGGDGCGGAWTPKQAARYIERFVKRCYGSVILEEAGR